MTSERSNFGPIKKAVAKDYEEVIIEGKTVLECSSCDFHLAELICVEQGSMKKRLRIYQCSCPICGDVSFKRKISSSRVLINPHKSFQIADTEILEKDEVMEVFVKLGKI